MSTNTLDPVAVYRYLSYLYSAQNTDQWLSGVMRMLAPEPRTREIEIGMIVVKPKQNEASFFVAIKGLQAWDRTLMLVRPIRPFRGESGTGQEWREVPTQAQSRGCLGSIDNLRPGTDYEYLVFVRDESGAEVAGPEMGDFHTTVNPS